MVVSMRNWINVEDSLPDKVGDYIVKIKSGGVECLFYDGAKFVRLHSGSTLPVAVSHWMHMPAVPKE